MSGSPAEVSGNGAQKDVFYTTFERLFTHRLSDKLLIPFTSSENPRQNRTRNVAFRIFFFAFVRFTLRRSVPEPRLICERSPAPLRGARASSAVFPGFHPGLFSSAPSGGQRVGSSRIFPLSDQQILKMLNPEDAWLRCAVCGRGCAFRLLPRVSAWAIFEDPSGVDGIALVSFCGERGGYRQIRGHNGQKSLTM